jgi:hypothetical protein
LAVKFKEQTVGWVAAAKKADAVLRSFGDYETYLEVIEEDMKDVVDQLQQLLRAAAAKHGPK